MTIRVAAGALLALAWTFCPMSPAMAGERLDFVPDHVPPEPPDATVAEIDACLLAKGPRAALQAAHEECESKVMGITLWEFLAMLSGCPIGNDKAATYCVSGVEKLRPAFVPRGPPLSAQGITAPELVAIENGCPSLLDTKERARCMSGVRKLKILALN
jgi:hypothetical protein